MSNDRERPTAPAASGSTDLLDLVRSAEETARLRVRKRTPATPMAVSGPAGTPVEEVVDVDEEAEDAFSTLPPMPVAGQGRERPSSAGERPSHRAAPTPSHDAEPAGGWPPAAGIVLVLALAAASLAVLAR